MISLVIRPKILLITIPLLTLLASSQANAEIYKWRDSRGVTQYSDRPPVEDFSKLSRNELVNSLQTKDLCTVGPIKKNVVSTGASTKDYSGFFTGFTIKTKTVATPVKSIATVAAATSRNVTIMGLSKTPSPVNVAATSPAATLAKNITSTITVGTKNVTVMGFSKTPSPVNVAAAPAAIPTATTPAKPVVITQPVVTTPAPVVTTQPLVATQVATASPTTNPSTPISDVANIIQTALMPAVNISKNITPVIGFNSIRVQPTTEIAPNSGGEFRIGCKVSHMSNDDPLVYPNQQGAAHHHTFFGNTSVNYKSDLNSFGSIGTSTCTGGIMNRSAYWVPSMINTETNAPIQPNGDVLVYYKHGSIDGSLIKPPPKALRMIAGDMKAKDNSVYNRTGFTCHPGPNSKRTNWPRTSEIPSGQNCELGDDLMFSIFFPQCWDGKNLDSPNHKDHMAYPNSSTCPATHPVAIPEITVNVHYTVKEGDKLDKWRLSSDNYAFNGKNGGYSGHSDYVEGWDRTFIEGIIKNCINTKKDCHAHLLGDGRMMY
ncbi:MULTISPECIES: DUF1996 domain-containing protein [Methylotenera]|uniref:DUF1996 domain-containing protein n=1 Tax=Methylotenera TaxID=359407 RepID=UPI000370A0F9|nr:MULTISPECIES: DUF1996 domain-containing protein [Methylotenera]